MSKVGLRIDTLSQCGFGAHDTRSLSEDCMLLPAVCQLLDGGPVEDGPDVKQGKHGRLAA